MSRPQIGLALCVGLLLTGLLGVSVASTRSERSAQGGIAPSVRADLLKVARQTAHAEGEHHPHDIQVVLTTKVNALRLRPGDSQPSCEDSPSCADTPFYVLAMRGHFTCNSCPGPPGARIAGRVITLEFEAATMSRAAFGLSNRYPDLAILGTVVRLDSARRHRTS